MEQTEVREIFNHKPQSMERKKLLWLLRNNGNMEAAVRGQIIPKKLQRENDILEKTMQYVNIAKHISDAYL